jgi:hypothetical protein
MKILRSTKAQRDFAAHSGRGQHAHWIGDPCPVERRTRSYDCRDDGFLHDSAVRNETYLMVAAGDPAKTPLLAAVAAHISDSLIAIGDLERAVIEHAGTYAAGPKRTDELPSVRMYAGRTGRYVWRLRGCERYRRAVRELFAGIPGVRLLRT